MKNNFIIISQNIFYLNYINITINIINYQTEYYYLMGIGD